MVIDCETCELARVACGDCVVSVLLGPIDAPALVPAVAEVADEHLAAVAVLADAGLVPPLRHTGTRHAAEERAAPAPSATVTPLRQRRAG